MRDGQTLANVHTHSDVRLGGPYRPHVKSEFILDLDEEEHYTQSLLENMPQSGEERVAQGQIANGSHSVTSNESKHTCKQK